jgi:hypothetical protein
MGFAARCSEWGRRREKGAEARRHCRLLFERGRVRQGAVGVGRRGRRVEEAGHEQGGPCRPVRGLPAEQRGERLTGGPRKQCWAAVPLTSGARRAAGEGERGGALIGGTGLSAGVHGGEAAAYVGRTWAGPGTKKGGPSNSRISDLFKSVLNKFKLI